MKVIVKPSTVSGTITAPASKSAMQRACAASLIKGGETVLHNPGISADDMAALDIIQQLGATVMQQDDTVIITSNGVNPVSQTINCGESGLSVRMFTPIASLYKNVIFINGHGSLTKRPLHFFNEVLPQLDVQCKSNNGYLPLEVKGPLQPKDIEVDGSLSSQFLTGLLMAFAGASANNVTIKVNNLASKPYIDLTLQVMKDFGLQVPSNENYERFHFSYKSNGKPTDSLHYTVEGDWSGGAFLLVAGAINGNIEVRGLDVYSSQADKAVLQALMQTGVIMSVEVEKITIQKSKLKAFHFNATDCPDLFPPLVALAAYCEGTSVIEGVNRLAHKESNRGLTLQEEFGKMGVEVVLQDNLMIIKGGEPVNGAVVSSHGDHRIAMACAVAALKAESEVHVEGAEAVNKSYPAFWSHLEQLQKS
ncbi:3-phosphoshikimate 1-carboxyvinyltransferase [Flavisolibacter tropicus]|uniref:3-phosphoshikimate 1-carboxyvinyltransferase n=1 Tax=Flavisolibacter tropicus TaxID=1492898 RepID=A0A172TT65_9BACT|nr:3-phosphoshikimate 1-carboxyvinyltransferase [Flavisolibacter tropicus]ANE50192.1 3-phosphoshikimate 1-carboxyvinyltransferase [Flavisolibacter tropicus]